MHGGEEMHRQHSVRGLMHCQRQMGTAVMSVLFLLGRDVWVLGMVHVLGHIVYSKCCCIVSMLNTASSWLPSMVVIYRTYQP